MLENSKKVENNDIKGKKISNERKGTDIKENCDFKKYF